MLTAADLGFSDPDDAAADVTFTVANLTAGTLRVNGAAATSFTGAQLAAGLVSFQHDGSETTAASFQVTVEDGNEDGSTPTPATFNFTVTAVNDAAGPHRRSHRHARRRRQLCADRRRPRLQRSRRRRGRRHLHGRQPAAGTLLVNGAAATTFTGAQLAAGAGQLPA